MRGLWAAGLALGLAASSSHGATSGADFLKIGAGARPVGLAEAYVAMADDATGAFWNPAGPGELLGPQVSLMHLSYVEDINFESAVVAIPAGLFGVGYGQAALLRVAPFDSTRPGSGEPAGHAMDLAGGLGWAYKASRLFTAGLSGTFISRDLSGYKAKSFGVNVGALFQPLRRLRIGLTAANLGPPVKFIEQADPLPGLARIGAVYSLAQGEEVRVLAATEADFGKSYSRVSVGLEGGYAGIAFLRAGYVALHDLLGLCLGAGFRWKGFLALDYAFTPLAEQDLGGTHRLSLSVGIPGPFLRPPGKPRGMLTGKGLRVSWRESPTWDLQGYNLYSRREGENSYQKLNGKPMRKREAMLGELDNTTYYFTVAGVGTDGREGPKSSVSRVRPPPPPRARAQGAAPAAPSAYKQAPAAEVLDFEAAVPTPAATAAVVAPQGPLTGVAPHPGPEAEVLTGAEQAAPATLSAPAVSPYPTAEAEARISGEPPPAAAEAPEVLHFGPSQEEKATPVAEVWDGKMRNLKVTWSAAPSPNALGVYLFSRKEGEIHFHRLNDKPFKKRNTTIGDMGPEVYEFAVAEARADGEVGPLSEPEIYDWRAPKGQRHRLKLGAPPEGPAQP